MVLDTEFPRWVLVVRVGPMDGARDLDLDLDGFEVGPAVPFLTLAVSAKLESCAG